ncbi:MAG TPA: hypothetical protein VFN67_34320 [Polyangiales bacterium]|nr:hypothetical protein [Polyangiales bacterium]
MDDPYTAVRYIADHSLRELGVDTQALGYDFVTPPSQRAPIAQRIDQLARPERSAAERAPEHASFEQLLRVRDDRPVQLLE